MSVRPLLRTAIVAMGAVSVVAGLACQPGLAKKTTITFAHWYNFNPSAITYMNNAVRDYQKVHPDVEIKQMPMAWGMGYIDKILTMAAAGKNVDVMMISGLLMTSMAGVLSEVDALVNAGDLDRAVSYKSMWRGCTYKGKVLGVPFGGGVQRAMFYNTDMMQQVGWDPSKPPTTWDSFLEFCKKLTFDKNGDGKPDIFATDTSVGMYQMMNVAAGGDYTTKSGLAVDWDSPASLKALEWASAIQRTKALGPWGGMMTGKCASYMQGPWETSNVQKQAKFKWNLTHYPTPTTDTIRLWASVDALGVGRVPNDRKKVAWDFVKFLMSPDMQARLSAEIGFPPMNKGALNTSIYKQAVEKLPQTAEGSAMMQYAFAPDPTPKDGDVNAISDKYLAQVISGSIGPREAATKMQNEATVLLARYAKKK